MPRAQIGTPFRVSVGLLREGDRHREHALGLEAWLGAEKCREAANEQSRGHEQHRGEHHGRGDEQPLYELTAPPHNRSTSALTERRSDVVVGREEWGDSAPDCSAH
jgi:hypothetical protein